MAFNRFYLYCRYRLRFDLILLLIFSVSLFLVFLSLKHHLRQQAISSSTLQQTSLITSPCVGDNCLLANDGLKDVVILLSYMRSGSTLIGRIILQDPQVFYLYEPFRVIHRFLENGSARTYDTITDPNFVSMYKKWLPKITSCDFQSTILSSRFMDVSAKRAYLQMEQAHMIRQSSFKFEPFMLQNNSTLIRLEEDRCDVSSLLAIKTIRITNLEVFWKTFQNSGVNLKIVHLIRDPRAVQNSRLSLKTKRNIGPRWICDWPLDNLKFIQSLKSNGASSINPFYYELKYEDFATEPLTETSNLFRFLNLSFGADARKFISGLTNSNETEMGGWWLTDRNIQVTLDKWKTSLSETQRLIIENDPKCQQLMDYFSYPWPYKP